MADQDLSALNPSALAPAAIEAKAESVGATKANMKTGQAFVMAMMAGMFIGMGGMFMTLVKSDSTLSFAASSLLGGLAFCLGLFLVLCAGSELFTGNCLMIMGRMSSKYSWGKMLKSWLVVWLGNFVGALLLVFVLYFAQFYNMNGGAVGQTMVSVAAGKIAPAWGTLFFKGIMCNFLVCLAVWIGFGGKTIVDKFVTVLLPIMAFVACGFEHCVANMYFLPMALTVKSTGVVDVSAIANASVVTLGGVFKNISAATLGNIVGGCIFVGLFYWLALAKKGNAKK